MKAIPRQSIPALIVGLLLLAMPDVRAGQLGRSPSGTVYAPDQQVVLSQSESWSDGGRTVVDPSCSYTGTSTGSCGSSSSKTLWIGFDGSWSSQVLSSSGTCTYETYSCTRTDGSGIPDTYTTTVNRGGTYTWSYNVPLQPAGTFVEYNMGGGSNNNDSYWVGWHVSHSPANGQLTSSDDLVIEVDTARSGSFGFTALEVDYSLDGGGWQSAALAKAALADHDQWTVNLGKFAAGARILYSVRGTDLGGAVQTLAQSGQETLVATVSGGSALQWLGNTYHWPVDGELGPANDLWINGETWPAGSASTVEAVYSSDGGLSWSVAPLSLGGASGNNDSWYVNLGSFAPGQTIEYVLVADDLYGTKIWDNNGGFNYTTMVSDAPVITQTPADGSLTAEDELVIAFDVAGSQRGLSLVEVVYSVDGGASWLDAPLALTEETGYDHWEVNLGAFVGGSSIQYVLVTTDAQGGQEWFNNGGANYTVVVEPPAIAHTPANGSLTSADDLVVSFDAVGPERGYELVEVVYSVDGTTWLAADLQLTVGTDVDHWEVNLGAFACGANIQYVLVGTRTGGGQQWFNNGGANYLATVNGGAYVNQVTLVTGPSPLITQSGVFSSSYGGWKAFNGLSNAWLSETWVAPAWLGYEFLQPTRVDRYSIWFTNGSLTTRAPRDFELQGWTGSAWVTLNSRVGETNWAGTERRSYVVANPGEYVKYRLFVTEDNDSRSAIVVVSIAELELEQSTGACAN